MVIIMGKYFITTVEEVNEHHRSNIIIHNPMYYFAEFYSMDQLQFFADMLGFTFELVETKDNFLGKENKWCMYSISHKINDVCGGGFWKLSDLPKGVKPFKALSNGSIVTCYFLNDGEEITIYRPNPNAKEVYKPLEIKEHIAHRNIYGTY